MAQLIEFGPVHFQYRGGGTGTLARFGFLGNALNSQAKGHLIELKGNGFGAERGIAKTTIDSPAFCRRKLSHTLHTTPGKAEATNHLALMSQQVFGNLPAFVQCANQLTLRDLNVVKERLAEGGGTADQFNGLRADSFRGHVKQEEADPLVFWAIEVCPYQAKNPVGLVCVGGPHF